MKYQKHIFTLILLMITSILTLTTQAYANPKKGVKGVKDKTAQQCQSHTSKISYQVGILKKRHQDLNEDIHNLHEKHNAKKNKHPTHGSYQGHIEQYEIQRKLLQQYITDAVLDKCEKYVSSSDRTWSQTKAPEKPNRSGLGI